MFKNRLRFTRGLRPKRLGCREFEQLETRHLLAADIQLFSDSFEVYQNQGSQLFDLLANDEFADTYAGAREITSVSFGSEGGNIRISPDRRSVDYSPPADFSGRESFTYFVDGREFAQVQVDVSSPLMDDQYEIPPDGRVHTLEVLENDPFWEDYQGERRITLTSVSSQGSELSISADRQSIFYRPIENPQGEDQFVYIVDGIYAAMVSIDVPQTLTFDRFEVVQNSTSNELNVLQNDAFWPGYLGEGRITSVTQSSNDAQIEISDDGDRLLYTPSADRTGWDNFHYVVDDRFEARVSLRIHRPVQDDWSELDRNSSNHVLDVLANDTYRDLSNRYRDVVTRITDLTQPESGGLVQIIHGGSRLSYTPPKDFSGSDTFTYLADGKHLATVNLQVTRPVRNDYLEAVQDTPGQILSVLENDFLGNGYLGRREITHVSQTEQSGETSILGKSITYTPPAEYIGSDHFEYTVDDDLSAAATVYVQPLAQSDSYRFCADPTRGPYTISVMANDLFHKGYTGPARITAVSSDDESSSVSVLPDGRQLQVTPSAEGFFSIRYTVDDKYVGNTWISFTGQLVGDHVVVDQNSQATRIDVLANDFARNGDQDSCRSSNYRGPRVITQVADSDQGGTVTILPGGASISYLPPEDFTGRDQFTYQVDGVMTSTVSVNVIRRVRDDRYHVNPADQDTLPVLVNDLFGADYQGEQRITAVTPSAIGASVQIAADGKAVIYQAPADLVATDRLTYTVDGHLKAEVEVQVRSGEQAPFPQFENLDEFEQFLLDDALARYEWMFGSSPFNWLVEDGFSSDLNSAPNANVGRGHSETNVQVEGVDEGDIVEFDDDYVYMLTGNDLVILDAWPADSLVEVSRHAIEGQAVAEFLRGDRLTVISEPIRDAPFQDLRGGDVGESIDVGLVDERDMNLMPSSNQSKPETYVTVFDVADRANPRIVQTTKLEGRYVESRGVGDHVYLVAASSAVAPMPEIIQADDELNPWDGVYETREQYVERFLAETGSFVEEALPNYASYRSDGELVRSGLVHQPEDIYQRLQPNASNLLSLISIDVTNTEPGIAASSGVYTDGVAKVYASLDHFYVFENAYGSEDGLSTRILKFDWDGESGAANLAASGEVAGWMLNQFSADEYQGHLRIVTTISNSNSGNWTGRAENDLFVLREDAGVLEFVGSLQNLALGETTRSVRFMGERAFLVTFRNVDPLFGLDVSDPTDPRSVGHLTLPGFSSYLQFVDENHLLAVGRNTPTGGMGPAQVSLFHVRDLKSPKLIDEFTFERFSTTEATIDHHAFGYFATHGLLAVPSTQQYVTRVDTDGDGFREAREWITEHELMVFRLDLNAVQGEKLELVAQLEHDSPVRRSGYIGDKLYSIAQDSVSVVDVADPSVVISSLEGLHRLEQEPTPIVPFLNAEGELAVSLAQQDLSERLDVEAGELLTVAAEPEAPHWRLVFRVDDRHYLYESSSVFAKLIDADFEFAPTEAADWHHVAEPADVNRDGEVTPNDVILIVNELLQSGSRTLPNSDVIRAMEGGNLWDVSGDGVFSPIDVLLTVNRLNGLGRTMIDTSGFDSTDDSRFSPAAVDRLLGAALSLSGDSNEDGRFDSADLVLAFQAGEYEDDLPNNSSWAEGDWNGDRDFDSADFVAAFQYGRYSREDHRNAR
ncbi:MAG: hypothetical protein GY768_19815 [Planctomycetaceae bacterium]|nr:hypothetical protein [Planctomycetaceae bacterium]